jgi:hypothetical protein
MLGESAVECVALLFKEDLRAQVAALRDMVWGAEDNEAG